MELSGVYIQLGILYILILTGYILGKLQVLAATSNNVLSGFIVKVALPAVIISSMNMPLTQDNAKRAMTTVGLSVLVYTVIFIVAWLLPKVMSKDLTRRGILSFSIMFSNCAFMGFPVLGALLGPEAIFYVSIYNIIFNILVFTLGIKFLESGKNQKNGLNMKLLFNPGVIASGMGLVLFVGRLSLPAPISGAVESVAGICTPLSMIVVGSMLSQMPLKKMFGDAKVYLLAVIRLGILPIIIFILVKWVIGIQDPWLITIPVVVAGMPVASNAAMMASTYDSDAEFASQAVMITTLISCISIPLLIYFL